MIRYSGFADEAGIGIGAQIRATRTLGWWLIELRRIGTGNLATLDDAGFRRLERKLRTSGVRVHCYGSSIANWGRHPLKDSDHVRSVEELQQAIPRLRALGTKYVRGMSYAILKERDPSDPEVEAQVFRKVGELVRICEDHGIIYLHENCMNYGGQSPDHTLRLLEKVGSPSLRLVFDTGNPVHSWDRRTMPPTGKQDSFDFYTRVKEFIDHVHIKDCVWTGESDGIFDDARHTFPGEGDGHVREILRDLIRTGYKGVLSIEPHLGPLFHDPTKGCKVVSPFRVYVEYGRQLMRLVEEERTALADGRDDR